LSVGACTLTQEGDGMVDGEVSELNIHQDLDQSLKEPKVVANLKEGMHRFI
jgi:hypothetical protein